MNSTESLTGAHQRTYDRIFQHPISHNLEWRDVRALLGRLGQIGEEPNGSLKVTRNGHSLVLHPTSAKDVGEMDELMALRHFLQRSETPLPEISEREIRWLLVIDHHEARIFRTDQAGTVQQRILPYQPENYFRHAPNSVDVSRGQEKPDPNTFFEPVAQALSAPGQIVIFGTGTGTSSEMEQFVAWLQIHHPAVMARVIGWMTVDEHHLTEGQLLEKARECYTVKDYAGHDA